MFIVFRLFCVDHHHHHHDHNLARSGHNQSQWYESFGGAAWLKLAHEEREPARGKLLSADSIIWTRELGLRCRSVWIFMFSNCLVDWRFISNLLTPFPPEREMKNFRIIRGLCGCGAMSEIICIIHYNHFTKNKSLFNRCVGYILKIYSLYFELSWANSYYLQKLIRTVKVISLMYSHT